MSDPDVAAVDAALARLAATPAHLAFGGSVHLHCTDADGEWLLVPLGTGGARFTREHAKGACAIRGTAAALRALAEGSGDLSGVEVIGDVDVAAGFAASLRLG